ncbi:phosphatidylinositol kinase [Actinomycetota bacterium]|nr:phosphatidylinositol kinase [Actinomycetota bacterium]
MSTTTSRTDAAYVWVWLPGASAPVVAGRLVRAGNRVAFVYGRSYLARPDAIALYLPELPLRDGRVEPLGDLSIAGCLADAGPDSWGQRVIEARHGINRVTDPLRELDALTYLVESGTDRIGGLDFQLSPTQYVPRTSRATLAELQEAAAALEDGRELPAALGDALVHGTSIGGARPKALIEHGSRSWIAKFSSTGDRLPMVRWEALGMSLARRVGLEVAGTRLTRSLDKDVLLVERFDRPGGGRRRLMVSALTMLGLHEMTGRYATYPALADVIRERFSRPDATLRELFARIVLNIAVTNSDDHARNHAAFWDGRTLTLTPAYDVSPQARAGTEVNLAMAIGRDGQRTAQFGHAIAAAGVFHLSEQEARDIVAAQVQVIHEQWDEACDEARLTHVQRTALWGRQVLHPWASLPPDRA